MAIDTIIKDGKTYHNLSIKQGESFIVQKKYDGPSTVVRPGRYGNTYTYALTHGGNDVAYFANEKISTMLGALPANVDIKISKGPEKMSPITVALVGAAQPITQAQQPVQSETTPEDVDWDSIGTHTQARTLELNPDDQLDPPPPEVMAKSDGCSFKDKKSANIALANANNAAAVVAAAIISSGMIESPESALKCFTNIRSSVFKEFVEKKLI